jgi:nitrogen fixation protein
MKIEVRVKRLGLSPENDLEEDILQNLSEKTVELYGGEGFYVLEPAREEEEEEER